MDPNKTSDILAQSNQSQENTQPKEVIAQPHTFELYKDYTLPPWSAKPTKNYL